MREFAGKSIAATLRLALTVLLLFLFTAYEARAQKEMDDMAVRQEKAVPEEETRPGGATRGGLLARLNLSPEQRAQIVSIRQQSGAEGRVLMQRLHQARRALDAAIYADQIDENLIEARAREVAAVQAELVRLRAITELKLRRALTSEQLGIWRDSQQRQRLRQQLNKRQENQQVDDAGNPQMRSRVLLNNRLRRRQNAPGGGGEQPTPSSNSLRKQP